MRASFTKRVAAAAHLSSPCFLSLRNARKIEPTTAWAWHAPGNLVMRLKYFASTNILHRQVVCDRKLVNAGAVSLPHVPIHSVETVLWELIDG